MTDSHFSWVRRQAVAFLVPVAAIAMLACAADPSSPIAGSNLRVAAGKSTGDVTVSSTKPDSATQDTTLDVVITGSGFVPGSVANWALAGVQDPAQVRTNSTIYVNSRQLSANITISATAAIASWDIVVMAGPKTGIGTEKFAIKARGNVDTDSRTRLLWDAEVNVAAPGAPVAMAPAGIQGDSRDRYGQGAALSEYQAEFCGVNSKIFWNNTSYSGSGDLTFDPDQNYSSNMAGSCGAKRTLKFHLAYVAGGNAGSATSIGSWFNARQVMQLGAPGDSRSQFMRFWYLGLRNCDKIHFDASLGSGTANVRVTRVEDTTGGARQWRVESEYPHYGMCTIARAGADQPQGTKYLPFAFKATEVPSPYPSFK